MYTHSGELKSRDKGLMNQLKASSCVSLAVPLCKCFKTVSILKFFGKGKMRVKPVVWEYLMYSHGPRGFGFSGLIKFITFSSSVSEPAL